MKVYTYIAPVFGRNFRNNDPLIATINEVAAATDTEDLVTALYLMPGRHLNRGTAYVRSWLTAADYRTGRGKWGFTKTIPVPDNLPEKYKLIRLRLDPFKPHFPRLERDIYGWEFTFNRFVDHLALLFAHELHHFRRHHLGLHSNEGEQGANKWALHYVRTLGYQVDGVRRIRKMARPSATRILLEKYPGYDRYRLFRNIRSGSRIRIDHDPGKRYQGQTAEVVRPIRFNSKRMVVRTSDGKEWRWPMQWLKIIQD